MSTIPLPDAPRGRLCAEYLKSLIVAGGDNLAAVEYCRGRGFNEAADIHDRLARGPVFKAGVTPHALDDALWRPVSNSLAEVLRPLSIIGRLVGTQRVPFSTRFLVGDVGAVGHWLAEGEAVPVSAGAMSASPGLQPKRCSAISFITQELARNAGPASDTAIMRGVASAVGLAMDRGLVDPDNDGTGAAPASVTYGAAQVQSTGATLAAITADLRAMVDALVTTGTDLSTAVWIMSPTTAIRIATLVGAADALGARDLGARGGSLLTLPVLTSAGCVASGSPSEAPVVLLEASELCLADDGSARLELSTQATIQADDAPGTGAQQLVSLWQAGLVGVKATRFADWVMRRPAGCAVLRGFNVA